MERDPVIALCFVALLAMLVWIIFYGFPHMMMGWF